MPKVRPNQLLLPKRWHGMTTENHLFSMYMDDPVFMSDQVERMFDVNLGEDFVSYMKKFPVKEYPKREYEWALIGAADANYEVVASWLDRDGTQPITPTTLTKIGANGTKFYLDFYEKPFSETEVIVGHRPDDFKLLVNSVERIGNIHRYEISLVTGSISEYIPASELLPGKRFSSDYGLVAQELSDRGFDIGFSTHAFLGAEMSKFRMQHTIPGNMIEKGKAYPLKTYFSGPDGSTRSTWLYNIEWEFMRKLRHARASLIMYGKSNRRPDGTYANVDRNGNVIKAGSGMKEQWASSNRHTYTLQPDIDELIEIVLAAHVGKTARNARKITLSAGEWGHKAFHEAVIRKFGDKALTDIRPWMGDNSGRAFSWSGNDLTVKFGQITKVIDLLGIEISLMYDPMKDDPIRNKERHPNGGLLSSYEYDIMDFGSNDNGEPNMQITKIAGPDGDDIFNAVNGMRSPFKRGGTSFMGAGDMATPVDATTIHYMSGDFGARVGDPTKVATYYPEI